MSGAVIGFVCATLVWVFLYGWNVPLRQWALGRALERNVRAEIAVRVVTSPPGTLNAIVSTMIVTFFTAGLLRGVDVEFAKGVALAGVLIAAVWPFYLRSQTRNCEIVVFDSEGVTILPPRHALVGQGTFETRIEWQDCFGYSVQRGTILFALKPLGHVEQQYGPHREEMERVLDSLGVRKLVAYDALPTAELDRAGLERLEARLIDTADDVIAGYQNELLGYGWRVEPQVLYNEEFDGRELREAHANMHLALWQGDECMLEQEWLIWEWDDESVEVLALPDDRLYESIDDRVHAMIEQRLREMGKEAMPTPRMQ